MSELPHYFGSLEDGHDERPGPIRTLVDSLKDKSPRLEIETIHHAGRNYALVEDVADMIDLAIAETAAAITQHREGEERYGKDCLRKVVIVTIVMGIRDLDEVVQLCEALSPFGCEHYADNAFNFRNCAVPYKPGDPNYQDPDE